MVRGLEGVGGGGFVLELLDEFEAGFKAGDLPTNLFEAEGKDGVTMLVDGLGGFGALFDLKAAGYSDQKKQDAGHKSEKMHRVYNRKLRIVEPAE